jgi:hypothetical protein
MRVANIITTNELLPERNFRIEVFIIPNKFYHLEEMEIINFCDIYSRTIFIHGLASGILDHEDKNRGLH